MSNSNPVSRIRAAAQLAEHAEAILALGKRAVADIISIGRHLIDAKAIAGHGGWLPWLEREFGWAERTARNYMRAAELATKSAMVTDLDIDAGALYRLSAPSTPAEVVEEVLVRGREGETITYKAVIEAEAEHAARVRYVESAPMRSTVAAPYHVPADQPAAEAQMITYVRGETEDPETTRMRKVAREVRWSLGAIADALAVHQIGAIILTWDDDDREGVRQGIEAVDKLKAALEGRENIIRFPDKPN